MWHVEGKLVIVNLSKLFRLRCKLSWSKNKDLLSISWVNDGRHFEVNEKIEEKVEICPFDFVQVFIAVTIKERDNFDENKTEPFYPLSVY